MRDRDTFILTPHWSRRNQVTFISILREVMVSLNHVGHHCVALKEDMVGRVKSFFLHDLSKELGS